MDGALDGLDIVDAALLVLREPDAHKKAELTNTIVERWQCGTIPPPAPGASHAPPPDRPARDTSKVRLVAPKDVPRRGKGGSLASRQALLHSLVHIENSAIDLAWDCIARFGGDPSYNLPRQFFDDFVTVAFDECRHFLLLERRLEATGSHYGALTAHDGLWESAAATAGSLAARLAVEHATHEARGLDVLPQTIARFRAGGDGESAELLESVILPEEVSHCAAGVRWLRHLHRVAHELSRPGPSEQQEQQEQQAQQEQQEQQEQAQGAVAGGEQQDGQALQAAQVPSRPGAGASPAVLGSRAGKGGVPAWAAEARQHPTVEAWFHALVRQFFFGSLKPPFNEEARAKAGFGPEWYLPLVQGKGPGTCTDEAAAAYAEADDELAGGAEAEAKAAADAEVAAQAVGSLAVADAAEG